MCGVERVFVFRLVSGFSYRENADTMWWGGRPNSGPKEGKTEIIIIRKYIIYSDKVAKCFSGIVTDGILGNIAGSNPME